MSRNHILNTEGYNQLAEGVEGYYLYNKNDIYIGKSIEKYGEYSVLEMELFKKLCSVGDVVIEVGANIGTHTIGLAKHVGQHGRVVAFEPQRLVFQTLCANVAINSLQNVECHLAALAAENGVINVPDLDPCKQGNFGGLSLLGENLGQQVNCYTLDGFISIPKLALIKIDVEGMENEVLKGGRQLIQKFKPFLYLENDRVEESESLMHFIDSLGYRMYWHLPTIFNPENYYGDIENIYPNVVSVNMFCVHQSNDISIEGLEKVSDFSFHPHK
jgi:FkbM family methyltransferase